MASELIGRVSSRSSDESSVTRAMMTTSAILCILFRKAGCARIFDHRTLSVLKAAPIKPPTTPRAANPRYSMGWQVVLYSTLKIVRPCELWIMLITESVKAALTAAVKARRRVKEGKWVLTSSRLNSTPPSGAPKAVLTPAAAAAE